jgi:hypothetical protein
MESPSPSTPDNASRFAYHHPGVRRVNTLPSKLISPSSRTSPNVSPAPDSVETLFVHTGTKVVSFNVQSSASARPGSSSGRRHDQDATSGTLAWDSPSERTMAAGMLGITGQNPYPSLTQLSRASESLSRAQLWSLISQLWILTTPYTTEITMLVRGRSIHVCATRKRRQFLPHRAAVHHRRGEEQGGGI